LGWSAKPTSWPQFPGTANPPSHHLTLESLLERHEKNGRTPSCFLHFLRTIWSHLKRNVDWYLLSQQSKIGANLFRWAGRTPSFCLPSGVDNYPRAPVLTDMEAHLDSQVWMIVSTRSIAKVAKVLNKTKDFAFYQERSLQITQALLDHFWDKDREIFDEFYLDANGPKVFDGHLGCLNFWPVFLDALDSDSKQVATILRKLLDQNNGTWTEFGLRSLSSNDPCFQLGDNYWTGPIWMTINYLVVSCMCKFVTEPDEHPMGNRLREDLGDTYKLLQSNLINKAVGNFVNNGFIWEVHDGDTGRGFNNHPFTGWSALIVNITCNYFRVDNLYQLLIL
jgi:mannosyl-oligosaccharide glucosidase